MLHVMNGLVWADDWHELAAFLLQERKEQGLNLGELAHRSGCSRRSIEGWEKGENVPSAANLMLWCKGLGLKVQLS